MADRFWVGGAGDWDDATNHWSDSSGGTPDIGFEPLSTDDVFFDTNSGLSGATINHAGASRTVNNFTASTGVTWDLTFTDLIINGQSTFEAGFNITGRLFFSGVFDVTFISGQNCSSLDIVLEAVGDMILTTNGVALDWVTATANSVTLGSDLTANSLDIYIFNAATFNVDFNDLIGLTGGSIDFGTGTWTCHDGDFNLSLISVGDGGTATLKHINDSGTQSQFTPPATFDLYNIWLTGTGVGGFLIGASFSCNELKIDGDSKTVQFPVNVAIDVQDFVCIGDVSTTYTLVGDGMDQWSLTKSSGTVNCDYLDLSYSDVGGGATWNAGANSIDNGNNTGWLFGSGAVASDTRPAIITGGYDVNSVRPALVVAYGAGDSARAALMPSYGGTDSSRGATMLATDGTWTTVPKPATPWSNSAKPTTSWTPNTKQPTTWSTTPKT